MPSATNTEKPSTSEVVNHVKLVFPRPMSQQWDLEPALGAVDFGAVKSREMMDSDSRSVIGRLRCLDFVIFERPCSCILVKGGYIIGKLHRISKKGFGFHMSLQHRETV